MSEDRVEGDEEFKWRARKRGNNGRKKGKK